MSAAPGDPSEAPPRSALRRLLNSGLVRKLSRYTAGSVVATVISECVFVVTYALGAAAAVASVAAFVAGAIPNYFLNRRWAWRRSGPHSMRQAVSYTAVVLGTALLAVVATSLTEAWSRHAVSSHAVQVFFGAAAYFLTYAVMFLVKFALFDRVVFADRGESAPAR